MSGSFYLIAFALVLVSIFPGTVSGEFESNICVFINAKNTHDYEPDVLPYFLSRFYDVGYPRHKLFVHITEPETGDNAPQIIRLLNKWREAVDDEYGSLEVLKSSTPSKDEDCYLNWHVSVGFLIANVTGLAAAVESCSSLPEVTKAHSSSCWLAKKGETPRDCSDFTVPSAKKCPAFGFNSVPGELNYDLVSLLDCMDDDLLYDRLIFTGADVNEERLSRKKADFTSYIISLERRPKNRRKVSKALDLLGLPYEIVDAVDGNMLPSDNILQGMKVMKNYTCPATSRNQLKKGEVGCLLSHRNVWKKIAESTEPFGIVFEDDVKLSTVRKLDLTLREIFKEANNRNLRGTLFVSKHALVRSNDCLISNLFQSTIGCAGGWDLIYLGRKYMTGTPDPEPAFDGAQYIHTVPYSHWTLGYALTPAGAKKLLRPEFLDNLVPVDEYIPIMYDQHPNDDWKARFPGRNLKAYCVEPVVVEPSYYPGDEHYVSDTEESPVLGESATEEEEEPDYSGSSVPIKLGNVGSENLWDQLGFFKQDRLHSSYGAREPSDGTFKRKNNNCTKIYSKCSQNGDDISDNRLFAYGAHRVSDEL